MPTPGCDRLTQSNRTINWCNGLSHPLRVNHSWLRWWWSRYHNLCRYCLNHNRLYSWSHALWDDIYLLLRCLHRLHDNSLRHGACRRHRRCIDGVDLHFDVYLSDVQSSAPGLL